MIDYYVVGVYPAEGRIQGVMVPYMDGLLHRHSTARVAVDIENRTARYLVQSQNGSVSEVTASLSTFPDGITSNNLRSLPRYN